MRFHIEIYINKCKIVSNGIRNSKAKILQNLFANKEINITVDIGLGKKYASILTCDLTEEYIKINAEYST